MASNLYSSRRIVDTNNAQYVASEMHISKLLKGVRQVVAPNSHLLREAKARRSIEDLREQRRIEQL